MKTLEISPEVRDILQRSSIKDNLLVLPPEQLERPLYEAVALVLRNAGAIWSKKSKGFLFAGNPAETLGLAMETGVIRDVVAEEKAEKKEFQAFYTPQVLAARVVELASIEPGHVVLEPSCGEGAIVTELLKKFAIVTAVDLNPEAVAVTGALADTNDEALTLYAADFLKLDLKPGDFDRVVMNPPFSKNQDITHVTKALTLLKRRGGILVAIMSPGTSRPAFTEMLHGYHDWQIEQVPAGTFKESGTNIATIILTVYT
jgi:predicted RNA methylase